MSQRIVVKSFADLALVLKLEDLAPEPVVETSSPPVTTATQEEPPDLARLLADLEAAGATLAEMTRRDEERRAQARRDLEEYDAVLAAQREAEQARSRAQQVRVQAEALAQTGFTEEVQATAARIAANARQAETAATAMAEQRRAEAERLAGQPDIQRLLNERRQQEQAEQARREEVERARRVSEAVEAGRVALQAGRLAEARAALDAAGSVAPDHPDVQGLRRRFEQREFVHRRFECQWRNSAGSRDEGQETSGPRAVDLARRAPPDASKRKKLSVCADCEGVPVASSERTSARI